MVVNEPISSLLKTAPNGGNLLLLFEVLDFGRKVNLDAHPDGFYPVV